MARFIKNRLLSKGQAPGSLIFIGNQKMKKPKIWLIEYDKENLAEKELKSIEECLQCKGKDNVSWINIYGIHDLEMMERLGEIFDLHHLLMEDILNTDQMPKYESSETYEAIIMKMLSYDEKEKKIQAEQITLILGEKYVLTIQEQPGDVFNPIRERIRNSKGRVRLNDNDYLAYVLLDSIVDNYIILIETIGRQIEDLEEKIFHNPDNSVSDQIYYHKTELNFLRKSIRPVKEIMYQLLKSEDTFFKEKNHTYLRDLNDLVNQTTETIELYNNILSDQLNIFNTIVNNKMNQVMKVLTIFASIFIPLTFFAGIYGMNFKYMPELEYRYGYHMFWIVIIIAGIGLLLFFKRKKWL